MPKRTLRVLHLDGRVNLNIARHGIDAVADELGVVSIAAEMPGA